MIEKPNGEFVSGSAHDQADARERAFRIASLFNITGPLKVCDFPGKGNINRHTYLVLAGPPRRRTEYLLQMLNPRVITRPRAVMEAMDLCIRAQRMAMSRGLLGKDEKWETITLVPSLEGKTYLELPEEGGIQFWRMMIRIPHVRTYRSLYEITDPNKRLRIAREAGRGLALFSTMTAGMDISKVGSPLPGYRNTNIYYNQLESVLAGSRTTLQAAPYLPDDPIVRQSTKYLFVVHNSLDEYKRRLKDPDVDRCISIALAQKAFCLKLMHGLSTGALKKIVVHGDTKLDNFLFNTRTGRVKALVDLDTVMSHTWLTDWGDMVRSLVNVAGERESNTDRVEADLEVFGALAHGFLRSIRNIDPGEFDLMTDAGQIMALELGVRFLADYLRGDTYFRPEPADPWDLNKKRALVQFSLFEKLRNQDANAKKIIRDLVMRLQSS